MSLFKNRTDAGQQLAKKLLAYQNKKDTLLLSLPRGGAPIAFEIAKVIIWAPNSHVGDVRATEISEHQEINSGRVLNKRERYQNESINISRAWKKASRRAPHSHYRQTHRCDRQNDKNDYLWY